MSTVTNCQPIPSGLTRNDNFDEVRQKGLDATRISIASPKRICAFSCEPRAAVLRLWFGLLYCGHPGPWYTPPGHQHCCCHPDGGKLVVSGAIHGSPRESGAATHSDHRSVASERFNNHNANSLLIALHSGGASSHHGG
jgi:hypothetical protein